MLPSPREVDRSKKARLLDVSRIRVVVRNRPLSRKEIDGSFKSILEVPELEDETGPAPLVIHEPKVKVDMTAYTEQHRFFFDAVRKGSRVRPPTSSSSFVYELFRAISDRKHILSLDPSLKCSVSLARVLCGS